MSVVQIVRDVRLWVDVSEEERVSLALLRRYGYGTVLDGRRRCAAAVRGDRLWRPCKMPVLAGETVCSFHGGTLRRDVEMFARHRYAALSAQRREEHFEWRPIGLALAAEQRAREIDRLHERALRDVGLESKQVSA